MCMRTFEALTITQAYLLDYRSLDDKVQIMCFQRSSFIRKWAVSVLYQSKILNYQNSVWFVVSDSEDLSSLVSHIVD